MPNKPTFQPLRWLLFVSLLTLLISLSTLISRAAPQADGGQIYLPIVANGQAQVTATPTVAPSTTPTTQPTTEPTSEPTAQPTAMPTPSGGPSSEALINAARQRGEINDETALLYKVYASFADPRLPTQFVGDDTNAPASVALREVKAFTGTLSPATQALLAPFFLPPAADGSWQEQQATAANANPQAASANRITWSTACKTDIYIKVWYQDRFPEDATTARQICDTVSNSIWIKLMTLMGRLPLSDENQVNSGGDNRVDLYLVPAQTQTVAYDGCDKTPSYILINHHHWTKATLTQVLMAAFLYSYPTGGCAEYSWLFKATAIWAVDYVFPADQYEQTFANNYLSHTDLPLNTNTSMTIEGPGGKEVYEGGYGAYLWLFFITHNEGGSADAIRKIWEAATNANSLEAINGALGGDYFKRMWNLFSTMNWNQNPIEDYKTWDNLTQHTKPWTEENVTLNGGVDRSYPLDAEIEEVASRTYHFTFTDPNVHSILFVNPFHDGAWPTAQVYAFVKKAGQPWSYQYWTPDYSKIFCQDVQEEKIEELVIVISNHEWRDRSHKLQPAYPPRLNVTNIACAGWKFEGTFTDETHGEDINEKATATMAATFMPTPLGGDQDSQPYRYYQVTEGSGTWTHSGSEYGGCTGSGSGSYTPNGGNYTFLFLHSYATDPATATTYQPGDRGYTGVGGEDGSKLGHVTYVCPVNGRTYDKIVAVMAHWFSTEINPVQQVSADGKTIVGSFSQTQNDGMNTRTMTWKWTMTALPPR